MPSSSSSSSSSTSSSTTLLTRQLGSDAHQHHILDDGGFHRVQRHIGGGEDVGKVAELWKSLVQMQTTRKDYFKDYGDERRFSEIYDEDDGSVFGLSLTPHHHRRRQRRHRKPSIADGCGSMRRGVGGSGRLDVEDPQGDSRRKFSPHRSRHRRKRNCEVSFYLRLYFATVMSTTVAATSTTF